MKFKNRLLLAATATGLASLAYLVLKEPSSNKKTSTDNEDDPHVLLDNPYQKDTSKHKDIEEHEDTIGHSDTMEYEDTIEHNSTNTHFDGPHAEDETVITSIEEE